MHVISKHCSWFVFVFYNYSNTFEGEPHLKCLIVFRLQKLALRNNSTSTAQHLRLLIRGQDHDCFQVCKVLGFVLFYVLSGSRTLSYADHFVLSEESVLMVYCICVTALFYAMIIFKLQLQHTFGSEERLTSNCEIKIRPKEDINIFVLFAPTRLSCMLAKLEIKQLGIQSQPGIKFTVRSFLLLFFLPWSSLHVITINLILVNYIYSVFNKSKYMIYLQIRE